MDSGPHRPRDRRPAHTRAAVRESQPEQSRRLRRRRRPQHCSRESERCGGDGGSTGEPKQAAAEGTLVGPHAPADMWRRQQALLCRLPQLRTVAQSPPPQAGGGLGCYYGSAPDGSKGKTAPLQVSSLPSPIFDSAVLRLPPLILTGGAHRIVWVRCRRGGWWTSSECAPRVATAAMAASASGARSPTAKAGPTVGETALPFTFTALLCYLAFILEMLVVPDVTINLCTNMFVPFSDDPSLLVFPS